MKSWWQKQRGAEWPSPCPHLAYQRCSEGLLPCKASFYALNIIRVKNAHIKHPLPRCTRWFGLLGHFFNVLKKCLARRVEFSSRTGFSSGTSGRPDTSSSYLSGCPTRLPHIRVESHKVIFTGSTPTRNTIYLQSREFPCHNTVQPCSFVPKNFRCLDRSIENERDIQ